MFVARACLGIRVHQCIRGNCFASVTHDLSYGHEDARVPLELGIKLILSCQHFHELLTEFFGMAPVPNMLAGYMNNIHPDLLAQCYVAAILVRFLI